MERFGFCLKLKKKIDIVQKIEIIYSHENKNNHKITN